MNTLKRWTTSVLSSVDWMITQVENHEALVNSAIDEVQRSGARARVQLNRVMQDGRKMRARLEELREKELVWKDRAVKSAALDEARALECMKRNRRTQKEIESLEEQVKEHARIERQLTADLGSIDQRLGQLKTQRNLLKTRQSRAEALRAFQAEDSHIISEIGDIFERWEVKVGEYELQGDCALRGGDDFEGEFVSQEEEEELRESLKKLLGTENETR